MAKKKSSKSSKKSKKESSSDKPSITKPNLKSDRDIAMDFAVKIYEKFDTLTRCNS